MRWKPQSERMTHGTDAEIQQDTQAITSTPTVHTPMTDIRDTHQPENGNNESENLGEWTPVKTNPNEVKTSTDLEHIESDELQIMGTGRSANKRKT